MISVLHIKGQSKNVRLGIKRDIRSSFELPRETYESTKNDMALPRTAVEGGKPNIKPATYDGTSLWQD